jgi:PilZ domain
VLGVLGHSLPESPGDPERRANYRFPISCEVAYKVLHSKGAIEIGTGQTVNMSSTGVLFEAQAPLPPGSRVQLSISWPVRLDDKCGLKLVAHGRIVRCRYTTVALEIERYEFRTGPAKRAPGSSLRLMSAAPAVRGAGPAFLDLREGTRGCCYDGSSAGQLQDSA